MNTHSFLRPSSPIPVEGEMKFPKNWVGGENGKPKVGR